MGWDDIDSLQIPLFNSLDDTTKERVEKNEITVVKSSAVLTTSKRKMRKNYQKSIHPGASENRSTG